MPNRKQIHGHLWRAEFRHIVYFYGARDPEEAESQAKEWALQEIANGGGLTDPRINRITSLDQIDDNWRANVAWNTPDDDDPEEIYLRFKAQTPLK